VMPPYAFLARVDVNTRLMPDHLRANRILRVPYTDEQLANAATDARAQAEPLGSNAYDFEQRYPGAAVRDFDGDPQRVTEMDALIAYLQMLGAGVDFETYQAEAPENTR
jgi:cytochrome c oxidase cbb3-type subunit 2